MLISTLANLYSNFNTKASKGKIRLTHLLPKVIFELNFKPIRDILIIQKGRHRYMVDPLN